MTDSGIIVTAADREAYLAFNMLPPKYAAAVRAGDWDHSTGMQAIARHAAQARLEALEEAGSVLVKWIAAWGADSQKHGGDDFWDGGVQALEQSLADIRSLAGESKL